MSHALSWKTKASILALVVAGWSGAVHAAENDGRLWLTASISLPVIDNLSATLDLQDRLRDDMSDLERDLVRPSLTYRWRPWLATTLGYDAHFIDSPVSSSVVEHRAWQQVVAPFDLLGSSVTPRVRLEERFIDGVSGAAVRARLGGFVRMPLDEEGNWSVMGGEELFVNLNSREEGPDSGIDQNRASVALARQWNEHLSIEVGYMNQWIDVDSADDLVNHVLTLTLRVR